VRISSERPGPLKSARNSGTYTGDVAAARYVAKGDLAVNEVYFTPMARTFWHTHAGGQILIIKAGEGVVRTRDRHVLVRVGDVIVIEPGEEHCHGASSTSFMVHTTVSIGNTVWLEEAEENPESGPTSS
jgi:quercetin dioxygenase-like cupin family protein